MKRKIVIAGGSGLVGSRLIQLIDKEKYQIYILSRSEVGNVQGVEYIKWDTKKQKIYDESNKLKDLYGVVNLAGSGIADKRWTEERKDILIKSRTLSSHTLRLHLLENQIQPDVLIAASAIGYYGDRGETILTEESKPGKGFLTEVCQKWESSNKELAEHTSRHAILRIGIVLSSQGGALKEILKTTRTGIYGYFGSGSAYYSWIHIDDLCRMIIWGLENSGCEGVYNATAPNPVTIKDLVRAVRSAKNAWGPLVPVPGFGLKLVLGEMANMLLNSTRVIPQRMLKQNFEHKFLDVQNAIEDILSKEV